MNQTRIPLHVSNAQAFVWSLDDVSTLRATHRLCGVLSGTLPQASQQNVFLGLPLILLPEEVVLLVNQGIACLVDDPPSHQTPTEEQLVQWNEHRKGTITRSTGTPGPAPSLNMSEEALKKRLERQKRKAAQATVADTEPVATSTPSTLNQKEKNYTFTIPSASSFPWYEAKAYDTLEEARAAGIWHYPSTIQEEAKCAIFKDLWKQGYYMGNGLRFGGDWLVYPGDPLRFHSHFVVTVFPSPITELQPMQLVAYGRLGTATKKSHLLCGWDKEQQQASYYSVEWAGFG